MIGRKDLHGSTFGAFISFWGGFSGYLHFITPLGYEYMLLHLWASPYQSSHNHNGHIAIQSRM